MQFGHSLKKPNFRCSIYLFTAFIFIFSLLVVDSGQAIANKDVLLNSFGTIVYPTPTVFDEMITLRGINCLSASHSTSNNMALIRNSGGNAIRILVYMTQITNPTYLQEMKDMVALAKANGLTVVLTFNGYYDLTNGEYESPVVMNSQHKAEAIFNENGFGDYWISLYSTAVEELQPDWVDPMNEPPNKYYTTYDSSKTYQQVYDTYLAFMVKCMDAFITIKPDLKFMFESCPFWDNSYAFVSPRIDELRPAYTIMYEVHLYYLFEGGSPADPSKDYEYSYWQGDLTSAKSQLYSYLLDSYPHIRTALDLDLDIYLAEAGTNSNNPNWSSFMNDMFSFFDTYNLGLMWHSWYYSGVNGVQGMLNEDWETLNSVGNHWANLVVK